MPIGQSRKPLGRERKVDSTLGEPPLCGISPRASLSTARNGHRVTTTSQPQNPSTRSMPSAFESSLARILNGPLVPGMPVDRDDQTGGRAAATIVLLSIGAGATDAFAFLALGSIFTANMTGNLVLIALFQRSHYLQTVIGAGIAIGFFILALFAGFRLSRTTTSDRRQPLGELLVATAGLQILVLVVWTISGQSSTAWVLLTLIALSASAMAFQTTAARRLFSRTGISTTFVTGTMTGIAQDIVDGVPSGISLRVMSVLAFVGGSFAGAAALAIDPEFGPAVPVVACLASVLVIRGSSSSPLR